jgi:hypothetical protein
MAKSSVIVEADLSKKVTYTYVLCGWLTHSDIPLTSVAESGCDAEYVDVLIKTARGRSPIVKNAGPFVFQHSPELSLIRIENVADFEISTGRQIRVWPAPRSTQKDIEIYLFGPAWAALCHQRGILPLHASAIVTRGGITAFAGHSGIGKSTIAASMSSLDYEVVADDILPISFNQDSVPGAWPYLRRLKLKSDSINEFALTAIEPVSETLDRAKYFVHPKYIAEDKWSRLDRLYLLEPDPTEPHVAIERLTGANAVHALVDQTYHFNFILGSGRFREHLAFCTRLASKILIYRLRRPPVSDEGKKLGSIICAHLEGGA